MTNGKSAESSAMKLLRHVWEHNREATGFSWTRLNGSMRQALHLAINAGLEFAPDDFATIYKEFRGGYWFTDDGGEGFYAAAVGIDNPSAYQSFEKWKERRPFNFEGQRMFVGRQFSWEGHNVHCTSFAADGSYFIAVRHKERPDDDTCPTCHRVKWTYSKAKIEKRHKITWDDLSGKREPRKRRGYRHASEQTQVAGAP